VNGIALVYGPDNDRLQELIARALAGPPGGHAMRATRRSGKRPYTILVGPVSREYAGLSTLRPAVCVVITDPDRAAPLLTLRLQAVYGLTEAESWLAEIFEKTGTRSQPELVALLLKTLAA
jgi:hypothetical protein